MHKMAPVLTFHSHSLSTKLDLLKPDVPIQNKPDRKSVLQSLIDANNYLNLNKDFLLTHDPATPYSSQKFIDYLRLKDAALNFLKPITNDEYIQAYSHPQAVNIKIVNRQSAGAELTCPAVPPSDGSQTTKPCPPHPNPAHHTLGPNTTEPSISPLHPDIAVPSVGAGSNFTLPATDSAMDITDEFLSPKKTIIDNDSSLGNSDWQKVHPKHTAKRKFQSPASPTLEQSTKFQTLDNGEDQEHIDIEEPQFQTAVSGPTGRIPPLIISNPQFNWVEFRKKILQAHPEEKFVGKSNGENFRLQMKTPNGYRLISTMLKNEGIQYSTYGFKEQNPVKAVIRNIPTDIPTEEIMSDLIAQNVRVQRVHQLKKSVGT
ncbi:hypothetical protein JTE90_015828 [Oedothorax gibbosus]|uniref:Pre-C2HC domain-containing protein n=1 Tax=Oedothorax gibbosus TaxID=931172 RepID=A0AAV6TSZ9_9ARAC|nr:hypothetical protein JTE90_015828 [Oedothorax gibbosus]